MSKQYLGLTICTTLFLLLLAGLSQLDVVQEAQVNIQRQTILPKELGLNRPKPLTQNPLISRPRLDVPNKPSLPGILRRMNVFEAIPAPMEAQETGHYFPQNAPDTVQYQNTDPKIKTKSFPDRSSEIVSNPELNNVPVASIEIPADHLFNKQYGILRHIMLGTRLAERFGKFSFYRKGDLQFETLAGIRVNGNTSRTEEFPSWGVYFRKEYGQTEIPKSVFPGKQKEPLKKITLRRDTRASKYSFCSPIGYEIAERLGCFTAAHEPVRLMLNGETRDSIYYMSQPLNDEFITTLLGHKDYFFADAKESLSTGHPFRRRAFKWLHHSPEKFTPQVFSKMIDLDNFLNWVISVFFCDDVDAIQGLMVFNKRTETIFFINHDMDRAFPLHSAFPRFSSDKTGYGFSEAMLKQSIILFRYALIRRLFYESEEARELLLARVDKALEEELTEEFIEQLIRKYRHIAAEFKIKDTTSLDRIELFLRARRTDFRQDVEEFLKILTDMPHWK